MRGKAISAAKAPRPVTNGRSSRRVTERPTKLMSGLALQPLSWLVMRGHSASEDARERAFDPRIHRKEALQSKRMDCRVKPGNDARGLVLAPMLTQRTGGAQRGANA